MCDMGDEPYNVLQHARKTTQSKFYATALAMMLVAVLEGWKTKST